jgi:hypothetical protein
VKALNTLIIGIKMPFTAEQKKAVIEEYRLTETDTGSSEVQVALLTAHILPFNINHDCTASLTGNFTCFNAD